MFCLLPGRYLQWFLRVSVSDGSEARLMLSCIPFASMRDFVDQEDQ